MNKETYERLLMDVTEFDVEDIITTSGETNPHNPLTLDDNEMALNLPVAPAGF